VHDIALSFDNGPDPSTTPKVLDVLAAREIPALFCVLGERLARPELRRLTERAHAEGHWIGNHTWTHRAPFGRLEDASAPHAARSTSPRGCWATSPTPTGCSVPSAAAGTSTSGC
jgi:peptidoglycan/xylan/chitin deacetylase (PgdA/CDA1 family)